MLLNRHQFQLEIMSFKSMNKKTKEGQVLLITLLVLTIIGIVIVGLVTLSNRDVTQVVTSEKYEKLYNNAETEVRKIVDNFGRYDKPLDSLPATFNTCTAVQVSVSYHCTIVDATTGSTNLKTDIDVTNVKDVQSFEVKKDRSFVLKMNNAGASYTGTIDISWDKPTAVEITLIAQDTSRNLKVIKDVYDLTSTYDGLVGDNPYNQPNADHNFNFLVLDPNNKSLGTRLNITPAGVKGLAATDFIYYLTLTPRLNEDNASVKFNIVSGTPSTFPYQVRQFISSSIDTNDSSSPLAKVITQIPLAPQIDSVFDYALISGSAINSY